MTDEVWLTPDWSVHWEMDDIAGVVQLERSGQIAGVADRAAVDRGDDVARTRPALAPGEAGRVPSTTAPLLEDPVPPNPVAEESWTWIPRKPVAPMWMVEPPRPASMFLATERAVPIGMA